jgi:flagellar hook assembly protein FlgD
MLCLFVIPSVWAAGITLSKVPLKLYREESEIEIAWQENLTARMKFGTSAGVYSKESVAVGTRRIVFHPQDEGMKPGIYYAIIFSGQWTSQEFRIIVESPLAPLMKTPGNNTTIQTSTPVFSWEPVTGVPYYHIFLSDQEVILSKDANGELQLQGGDILWQAITPSTSIAYGALDPSGYFNVGQETPPPLMNGFEYNWIVLSNYGNHPALSSTVQAGVSAFRVQVSSILKAPGLLTPVQAALTSESAITFSWSPVQGVSAYQLLLSEAKTQEGSESSFLIWQPVTTETSLSMPARLLLRAGKYTWKVLALDGAGGGVSSETRTFIYQVPQGQLSIRSLDHRMAPLPRVEIELTPESGSTEIAHLLTSDYGRLSNDVQPGVYQLRGHKEGFADTTVTVSVAAGEIKEAVLVLREWLQTVSGQVVNQSKIAVDGATVIFRNAENQVRTTTTDSNGRFSQNLAVGTWFVSAEKEGHVASVEQTLSLTSGQILNLSRPIELRDLSSQLFGRVVSDKGLPVQNARIVANKDLAEASTFSDANGHFVMTLAEGTWQVFAEKTGYVRSFSRSIQIKAGETLTLQPDLLLTGQAALATGFVLTPDKALADAVITATPLSGVGTRLLSSAKGAFTLSLAAGVHRISAVRTGYIADHDILLQMSSGQTISDLILLMNPATVRISGKATSNGAALAGVIVKSENSVDTTAIDGSFQLFENSGTHLLHAQKRGYVPVETKLTDLKDGDVKTSIALNLGADAGVIEGQIVAGSLPVAGADVVASNGTQTFNFISKADGRYVAGVPAGIWTITAQKAGFAKYSKSGLAINAKQTLSGVDLNLVQSRALLQGQVTDSKKRVVKNAVVKLVGTDITAGSDSRGEYVIPLNPGRYQIQAQKAGYLPQSAGIVLAEGATLVQNFQLQNLGVVRGIVQDNSGQLLQNVILKSQDTLSTKTDYAGEYLFYFRPGTYTLTADKLGYTATSLQFTIQSEDTLKKNLTLTANPGEIAIVTGKIRNSLGQVVPGASMQLSGAEAKTVYSDQDGNYSTGQLASGLKYGIKPVAAGRFFVPSQRTYDPLAANATEQNFVSALYGDVSANEQTSSFDGSLILRIKAEQDVSPNYKTQPRDSIAADVSANHEVSPFDASLIFRYAAGLISEFPAQKITTNKINHPAAERRNLALVRQNTPGRIVYALLLDRATDVWAGTFTLSYDAALLGLSGIETDEGAVASYTNREGRLTIYWARSQAMSDGAALLQVMFQPLRASIPEHSCLLEKATINEGEIPLALAAAGPTSFCVYENYPNPFNGSTTIRYVLAGELGDNQHVRIELYNVLGEKIATLLDRPQQAGFHSIVWNGQDDQGLLLASGVYFCRVAAARNIKTLKLLLVR